MKTVYRATNIIEADIVAGMLKNRGIEVSVAGRHLQTAVGAATLPYSSKVLVNEQQYDDALAVVAEYESTQPDSEQKIQERKPFAVLGLFTKPVLFWISVFLLLTWFFISGPPTLDQGSTDTVIILDFPEWEEEIEQPLEE